MNFRFIPVNKIIAGTTIFLLLFLSPIVLSETLEEIYQNIPGYVTTWLPNSTTELEKGRVRDRLIFFAPFLSYFSTNNEIEYFNLILHQLCHNARQAETLEEIITEVTTFFQSAAEGSYKEQPLPIPENKNKIWQALKFVSFTNNATGHEFGELENMKTYLNSLLRNENLDISTPYPDDLFLPISLEHLQDQDFTSIWGDKIYHLLIEISADNFDKNARFIIDILINQFKWIACKQRITPYDQQGITNLILITSIILNHENFHNQSKKYGKTNTLLAEFLSLSKNHFSDDFIYLACGIDIHSCRQNISGITCSNFGLEFNIPHCFREKKAIQTETHDKLLSFSNDKTSAFAKMLLRRLGSQKSLCFFPHYSISGTLSIRANLISLYGDTDQRENPAIHITADINYSIYLASKLLGRPISDFAVFQLAYTISSNQELHSYSLENSDEYISISHKKPWYQLQYFTKTNITPYKTITVYVQFLEQPPFINSFLPITEQTVLPTQNFQDILNNIVKPDSVHLRNSWIKPSFITWLSHEQESLKLPEGYRKKLELVSTRLAGNDCIYLQQLTIDHEEQYRNYIDMLSKYEPVTEEVLQENTQTALRMKKQWEKEAAHQCRCRQLRLVYQHLEKVSHITNSPQKFEHDRTKVVRTGHQELDAMLTFLKFRKNCSCTDIKQQINPWAILGKYFEYLKIMIDPSGNNTALINTLNEQNIDLERLLLETKQTLCKHPATLDEAHCYIATAYFFNFLFNDKIKALQYLKEYSTSNIQNTLSTWKKSITELKKQQNLEKVHSLTIEIINNLNTGITDIFRLLEPMFDHWRISNEIVTEPGGLTWYEDATIYLQNMIKEFNTISLLLTDDILPEVEGCTSNVHNLITLLENWESHFQCTLNAKKNANYQALLANTEFLHTEHRPQRANPNRPKPRKKTKFKKTVARTIPQHRVSVPLPLNSTTATTTSLTDAEKLEQQAQQALHAQKRDFEKAIRLFKQALACCDPEMKGRLYTELLGAYKFRMEIRSKGLPELLASLINDDQAYRQKSESLRPPQKAIFEQKLVNCKQLLKTTVPLMDETTTEIESFASDLAQLVKKESEALQYFANQEQKGLYETCNQLGKLRTIAIQADQACIEWRKWNEQERQRKRTQPDSSKEKSTGTVSSHEKRHQNPTLAEFIPNTSTACHQLPKPRRGQASVDMSALMSEIKGYGQQHTSATVRLIRVQTILNNSASGQKSQ